jgi:mannitol/fructose-specific phosphotransferase system IIA component (Ntr-type)
LGFHKKDWIGIRQTEIGKFCIFSVSPTIANDLHIEILSKIIKIIQVKENQEKILNIEN